MVTEAQIGNVNFVYQAVLTIPNLKMKVIPFLNGRTKQK